MLHCVRRTSKNIQAAARCIESQTETRLVAWRSRDATPLDLDPHVAPLTAGPHLASGAEVKAAWGGATHGCRVEVCYTSPEDLQSRLERSSSWATRASARALLRERALISHPPLTPVTGQGALA